MKSLSTAGRALSILTRSGSGPACRRGREGLGSGEEISCLEMVVGGTFNGGRRMEKPLNSESSPPAELERFVKEAGPRLKQGLIASFGGETGREATAEALSYAWANWSRIEVMENPTGYVYQVGRNWARRAKRRQARRVRSEAASSGGVAHGEIPLVEPGLLPALGKLSEKQRISAVLVHGFGWTLTEVAELMDLSIGSVQKHAERGLSKLRKALGAEVDANR